MTPVLSRAACGISRSAFRRGDFTSTPGPMINTCPHNTTRACNSRFTGSRQRRTRIAFKPDQAPPMVTPGDLPPQQQADVDDPSKHLEEHVSSAAHLKASQAADIEAAVRQDLASELGGEYVQPLEVLNLLQLVQLTPEGAIRRAYEQNQALPPGAVVPNSDELIKKVAAAARRLLEDSVPQRLLRSLHAALLARDPSMPRWVSPADGSINLAVLDAYLASEEMGFEGGQLRGAERQQVAGALHRLRRVLDPQEEERLDVLALDLVFDPDAPGIMCAIAAAFPERYLQDQPLAKGTAAASAAQQAQDDPAGACDSCRNSATGWVQPLPALPLPPHKLTLDLRGFIAEDTVGHQAPVVCVDTGLLHLQLRPGSCSSTAQAVGELGLRLGLLRWFAQQWYGLEDPGAVRLWGKLVLPLCCRLSLGPLGDVGLQDQALEEWGYGLYVMGVLLPGVMSQPLE